MNLSHVATNTESNNISTTIYLQLVKVFDIVLIHSDTYLLDKVLKNNYIYLSQFALRSFNCKNIQLKVQLSYPPYHEHVK